MPSQTFQKKNVLLKINSWDNPLHERIWRSNWMQSKYGHISISEYALDFKMLVNVINDTDVLPERYWLMNGTIA